jgi:hypothetical protein
MKRQPFILLCCLLPIAALAATPEERGLEIATEADRKDTGWHDFKASMTMLLRNKHGEESLRNMRTQSLEVEGDGDKTLILFDRPLDVHCLKEQIRSVHGQ